MKIGHTARIAVWVILGFLLVNIVPSTSVEAQNDDSYRELGFLVNAQAEFTVLVYGLGDSVASGHGLDGATGDCLRAPGAYPLLLTGLLADLATVEGINIACSGATTADLKGQVDLVLADLAAKGPLENTLPLVTITMGANDFGWTDIAALAPIFCGSDEVFRDYALSVNKTVKSNLEQAITRLIVEGQARVIITEYHNPLNTESTFLLAFSLIPTCFFNSLSVADLYGRAEAALHLTNSTFKDMAAAAGPELVRLAQVHSSFHGHEAPRPVCGAAPPDLANSGVQDFPDCFHPNSIGAQNYANIINATIR